VQVKSRSNTWDSDQLTPSTVRRQAGSAPDQSHMAEQEGTVNPAGETTEMLADETMENDGNEMQSELKWEWDDKPIFPWGNQDADPDAIAMQSDKETMRAPPLMELLPQARPQRCRRMPRHLEDYKLRRVKRARHLQVSSPTESVCSRVTLENGELVSRSLTLHCSMIRSEIHETYRPNRYSDSFDLAGRIFGDGRSYCGAMSDPPCRLRQAEHRSMSGDRRRLYDRPPPYDERRYGQDVPFDPRARISPMERRKMERRRWSERPCRPYSPEFERGRRPFRPGFRARGRPFVPRSRPVTRAHMAVKH